MNTKGRTWIGLALFVILFGAALIGVSMMVREGTRPRLGALNCGHMDDDITRTVCRQIYTRNLDRALAQDYYAAVVAASGDAANALERTHAEFVRKRTTCFPIGVEVALNDVYRCVEQVYREAREDLRAATGELN